MYGILLHTNCSSYFITQIVWLPLFLFHLHHVMHMHIPTHPHMCALKYKIQNCELLASDMRCDIYTLLMFVICLHVRYAVYCG